jgi:hypothetical protein
MSNISYRKQSNTNNIIVLAKFQKSKNMTIPKKGIDAASQLEIMIRKSAGATLFARKDVKLSGKKFKNIIKTKLKKRFVRHVEYLRGSVQEIRSMPLTEAFKLSQIRLNECIKNVLFE